MFEELYDEEGDNECSCTECAEPCCMSRALTNGPSALSTTNGPTTFTLNLVSMCLQELQL